MNEPSSQPNKPRSFILRLLLDEKGELHGQISEPGSSDEWRTTFVDVRELVALVLARLGARPPLAYGSGQPLGATVKFYNTPDGVALHTIEILDDVQSLPRQSAL